MPVVDTAELLPDQARCANCTSVALQHLHSDCGQWRTKNNCGW